MNTQPGYHQLDLYDHEEWVCLTCDGRSKRADLHRCAAHKSPGQLTPKQPKPKAGPRILHGQTRLLPLEWGQAS